MKLVTLHWTQQPHKAYGASTATHGHLGHVSTLYITEGRYEGEKVHSEWYDAELARRAGDPAAVAQELDIAYLSSGFPVFSPDWARQHLERVQQASIRTQPIVSNEVTVQTISHEERPDGEFWWWGCGSTAEGQSQRLQSLPPGRSLHSGNWLASIAIPGLQSRCTRWQSVFMRAVESRAPTPAKGTVRSLLDRP